MTLTYWLHHILAAESWDEEHVGLAIFVFAVVGPMALIFA